MRCHVQYKLGTHKIFAIQNSNANLIPISSIVNLYVYIFVRLVLYDRYFYLTYINKNTCCIGRGLNAQCKRSHVYWDKKRRLYL